MKILILKKTFSYLLNDLRNFNEIFRKPVNYNKIKSKKKAKKKQKTKKQQQSFALSMKNNFLEKPQGGGV